MAKVKKWVDSRKKKAEGEYDEAKREFEMAIGKPFIHIKVELPKGFEEQRAQFMSLEGDQDFINEVRDLIKKRLTYKKHGINP